MVSAATCGRSASGAGSCCSPWSSRPARLGRRTCSGPEGLRERGGHPRHARARDVRGPGQRRPDLELGRPAASGRDRLALISTTEVARRAQQDLEGVPEASGTPEDLLAHVEVTPVAESNIVSVTADAGTPEDAAAIANAFADATIAVRTDELHSASTTRSRSWRRRQRGLERRHRRARAHRARDRTRRSRWRRRAQPNTTPVKPKKPLSIAAGLFAGLILGIGGAFAYPGTRPAPASRGAAARGLPAADPRARPQGGGQPREARSHRAGCRPRRSRPTGPCGRPSGRAAPDSGRLELDPDHEPVGLRGQDDDRDQPRRVAGPRRQQGDPDRVRPAQARDRLDARAQQRPRGDRRAPGRDQARGRPGRVAAVRLRPAPAARRTGGPVRVRDPLAGELAPPDRGRDRARRLRDHRLRPAQRGRRRPAARRLGGPGAAGRAARSDARPARSTELGELLAENRITPPGFALLGSPHASRGYYYEQGRRLRRDQPSPSVGDRAPS